MDEFKQRRAKLAQSLSNDSIALVFGAKLQHRNSDVEYFFRQNSDFYYLTGFTEPNAVMVLTKDGKGQVTYILFNQPNDPTAEIWNGKRAGQIGAVRSFGADEAHDIAAINQIMPGLFANKKTIYYALGISAPFEAEIQDWLKEAKRIINLKSRSEAQSIKYVPDTMVDLAEFIHAARLFKSPQEIENMRKAAEISAAAHKLLMENCKPGLMEYQLEAMFSYHCLYNGCRGLAYNSIVAGGDNACILHYVTNDQVIKDGDLVLVDAGGEYNYYAADITRTFPANGKFTPAQRAIYELVLQAQLAGIAQVKPGNKWDSVQNVMLEIMVKGLVDLGIMQGEVDQLIADQSYKQFYMHSSGHWLGMDVHDVGEYKINAKWRAFEPGMVLTVEPGIYIAPTSKGVDAKWLGIGVRIEDDILVTDNGNEVLSILAPKQVADIERATM